MKKFYFLFLFLSFAFYFSQNKIKKDLPYNFYENKGQIIDQNGKENSAVKYLFNSGGLNVQIKKDGFSYDVYEVKKTKNKQFEKNKNLLLPKDKFASDYNFKYQYHRVDIDFVGANKNPEIIAIGKSNDYDNYYNVPNKPKGVEKVYRYQKIIYKNLYPNVDLAFFKPDDTLKPIEYNFIINPGGKISDIKLKFKGAKTKLKNGKLSMNLRFGEMQENIPNSWIEDLNSKKDIKINFKETGNQEFGFESSQDVFNKTVVIDPVPTLLWLKNLPNLVHNVNNNYKVLVDKNQNIVTSVNTLASYNLATDSYNLFDFNSIDYGYVSKYDSSGNKIWGTFIGNSHQVIGFSFLNMLKDIALDSNDNVYLVGHAGDSPDGTTTITSAGAYKEHSSKFTDNYSFENDDAYIIKLDGNGIRKWGTYYGGNSFDTINSAFVDSDENLVIAGQTASSDGIVTPDAYLATSANPYNGLSFISKFSKDGNLIYGSYFNVGQDLVKIAKDSHHNIYVVGNIPEDHNVLSSLTTVTHQQTVIGALNTYVVKLNEKFIPQWYTYFGGRDFFGIRDSQNSGFTEITNFEVDHNDDLILLGNTTATERISTPGAHQTVFNSVLGNDIFLTKFNSEGNQIWGTYFGATTSNAVRDDQAFGISIDEQNNIFFSGQTFNNIQIATVNSFLPNDANGYNTGFFTKFSPLGAQIWGSYFYRAINSIFVKDKYIYILGGVQTNNNFAKFYDCTAAISTTANSPVCPNSDIKLKASGGTSYSWTGPNNFTSTDQNPTIPNATAINSGTYSCKISGTGDCDGTFTVDVKVEDKTAPVPNIANLQDISGDCKTIVSVIPTATDACAGNIVATTKSPLQYSIPGTYVIVWDYDDGNGNISHQNQNVIISSPAFPTANATQEFCSTENRTVADLQISGKNIIWYDTAGTILDPTSKLINGDYYASQNINGCESDKIKVSVKINITPLPTANADQDFCSTQNAKISDLKVTGTNLKFYNATGNPLANSVVLQDNTSYFVSQTVNSCESDKFEIKVVISQNALPANNYSFSICNDTTSTTKTEDLTKYQDNLINNSSTYIFEYFDQNQVAISDFKNRTLSLGQNIFNVKVSTNLGCFKIVQLTLQLNKKPEVNLPETAEFCNGKSVELDAGFNLNYSYEWSSGQKTNKISINQEGTYTVKVTSNFGCENTASTVVKKSQIAEILNVQITNNNATIILSATGDFEYSLDNKNWQDSNEFKNLANGNYTVYVRTKLGCIIGEKDFSIFNISNSFSPNGDGKNDTWKVDGLENYPNSEVSVYDNQGKRVLFKITSGTFEWDGKLNSRNLPTATYWYNIKVSDGRILNGYLLLKNRN